VADETVVAILACAGSLLGIAAFSLRGGWRRAFAPFRISPRRMTVARLGLCVRDTADIDRVDTILASFLGGFNDMLTARTKAEALASCDGLPTIYRAFAHEGLAMGYTLRSLFRYDASSFEREIVRPRPAYRYLYYVGLGFWSGMRNHPPTKVHRIVEGLDPLHRYLVFDGYGFKVAFFDAPRTEAVYERLSGFSGYARNAAYQGVGRALYFRFMADPQALIEHVRRLDEFATDAAAGVGLASVFVNADRLERAARLASLMPEPWRPQVHLGMCFGLKARAINDIDRFDHDLGRLDVGVQQAVRVAIRECDRIELLVRSEGGADPYRTWRERVTAWMADHIEYPLSGVRRHTDAGTPRGASINASAQRQPVEFSKRGHV